MIIVLSWTLLGAIIVLNTQISTRHGHVSINTHFQLIV